MSIISKTIQSQTAVSLAEQDKQIQDLADSILPPQMDLLMYGPMHMDKLTINMT